MNKIKRYTALLMTVLMIVNMIPVNALAADEWTQDLRSFADHPHQHALGQRQISDQLARDQRGRQNLRLNHLGCAVLQRIDGTYTSYYGGCCICHSNQ